MSVVFAVGGLRVLEWSTDVLRVKWPVVGAVMTLHGYRVLLLGQHTYRPGHVGTRAPVRLGIRVGVQSNPTLTMPSQGRGIRRGGRHLPGFLEYVSNITRSKFAWFSGMRA